MPRHRLTLARWLIFASLPIICLQGQAVIPDRFLYLISCDDRVDKLDAIAGRKIETYDLAKRTGRRLTLTCLPTFQIRLRFRTRFWKAPGTKFCCGFSPRTTNNWCWR